MKKLLIFLALCTLVAAMVPRERRSENAEKLKCDPQTPCAWAVLKTNTKIIDAFLENDYCECPSGLTCQENELDDRSSYVYKCKPPAANPGKSDEH